MACPRLLAPENAQDTQEQVDDVHIERRGTVDGVVQRLGNLVCPPPVDAHVAAEDQHDDPIDHAMVDAEDEHLDQLDDDHQQQRDRQRASDAGEELWKQRTQHHHAQSDQRSDADGLMHQRRVVAADHQVDDESERHHHQVVTEETHPGLVRAMK